MTHQPLRRPTVRRCILYMIAGLLLMLTTSIARAGAQEPVPEASPTPAESDTGDSDSETGGSGGLDFGDAVTVNEDGTVVWNQEADTDDAEETVTPTPETEAGVDGTGGLDPEEDPDEEAPAGAGGSEGSPPAQEEAAKSGIFMILAIVGGAIAVLVGSLVFIRNRRADADLEVVEDVITPGEALLGEEPTGGTAGAYPGADEAGAYEAGGAAYAQHTEGGYEAGPGPEPEPAARLDQIRESMVNLADRRLAEAGHDRAIAKKLEAAGSKMRPGEWVLMAAAGTIGALFGATFVLGWLVGVLAAVLVGLGFWVALSRQEGKRQDLFAEALPETLGLLAGSLRGGLSMMQAIHTVADEADEPTAEEFQRVITETRLGRDLAISFRDLATRMGSKDFEWVVTAIEIHREVGGDLSAILDRVANTIRARNRVRGQVKALSAEGRASGIILFILPPGMVAAISVLNREYLNEMLGETEGQIMLVVSAVFLLVGGAWLKRLARFVY